jgi:hypothetical protein
MSDWRVAVLKAGVGMDPRTAKHWFEVAEILGAVETLNGKIFARGPSWERFHNGVSSKQPAEKREAV